MQTTEQLMGKISIQARNKNFENRNRVQKSVASSNDKLGENKATFTTELFQQKHVIKHFNRRLFQ